MLDFVKPNATVIGRIVYYSILLKNIKITLLQLRRAMLMLRGLSITIPNYKDLKEVETQLMYRANEIQFACMILLKPIFKGIDFGHNTLNHWAISMSDIKRGYCQLEEILQYDGDKPKRFGRKFIVLLEDFNDGTLGKWYAGELIEWEKAQHFIDLIPEKVTTLKGLYEAVINHTLTAMNYRLSKRLSDE